MKKILLALAVLILAACGTTDSLDTKTETAKESKYSTSNRQVNATAMIDPDLEIEEFYFVCLNDKLKPKGDTVYGTPDPQKKHTYHFPKTDLKTDIALFEVVAKGKSGKASVTFNTITDLGWRNDVGVTFLSTMLVPRIKELYLKHDYPLETAKYTSLREFEREMLLQTNIFDYEDFSPLVFSYYSGQAFNYVPILWYPWYIIRGNKSPDEYQQIKTSLAESFKEDGSFNDADALVAVSDFANSSEAKSLALLDSMINTYKKEDYWGYLELKILTAGYCGIATIHYDCALTSVNSWLGIIPSQLYGFGKCSSDIAFQPITNISESSKYKDEIFYCDIKQVSGDCDTSFVWRTATALEKGIGLCYGDTAAKMDYATFDSVTYKCAPDWNWYPVITSEDFLKLEKAKSTTAKNIYFVEDRDIFMSTAYSYKRSAYQIIGFAASRCKKTERRNHFDETDKYW